MLFRVIQELVNNALKHSDATNITIQITIQPETLLVLVEDDGKGFEVNNENKNNGLGLANIQNRVNYLKGNLNIESELGKGTTVLIHLNI
jgi:signal transduction histidine kinase